MSRSQPHALIVGCGFLGQRLARVLKDEMPVVGVVRTEQSRENLLQQGLEALAFDFDSAPPGSSWPVVLTQCDGALLFYLAPPPSVGLSDTRLDRFLARAQGKPAVFIYVSTTGVYGDRAGEEVDESTPVDPQTDRAQRRMSAEHMTRIWCTEREVRRVVLRVPGIYGPGRLALGRLQRHEPFIRVEEAGVSNRIHVDDLVAACLAAARHPEARGVYNVTDGNSISSTAFMRRVAKLANLPPPVEVTLAEARRTMSPERLSFLDESRRVSNRRMLSELGVRLTYADIDAGIKASL